MLIECCPRPSPHRVGVVSESRAPPLLLAAVAAVAAVAVVGTNSNNPEQTRTTRTDLNRNGTVKPVSKIKIY